MAFYEFTTIIRPDVPTTTVETVSGKIADMVKKHKGKIIKTEQWGLRTLAYAIKKHRKGYYTLHGLQLNDASAVNELEYAMKLSDDVIRFMTVKVDEISKEPSAILKAKARAEEAELMGPQA